jgi:preprotein translocase subunit SecF
MLNIIGNKYIFLTISGMLVTASLLLIIFLGFRQGIDFVGGTLWQLKFGDQKVQLETLQDLFAKDLTTAEVTIHKEETTNSFIVRMPELDETTHASYLGAMKKKLGPVTELSYETIGPSIGNELRKKSFYAFALVLLTISLYIAFAFRKVSTPVKSWKYGLITLVTLFHDAIIPAGFLSFMGWYNGLEVGANFVVALLVVMGFSVHDTIVIFDRIRENIKLEKNYSFHFANLVNKSVNETLARSINTSLTLVLVLLALFLLGSANLQYFVFTILIGTVIGTYSSIFIASPLLVLWSR